MTNRQLGVLSFPVIVAALGYFVDIYDLLLFSIIRIPSLKSLGLNDVSPFKPKEKIIEFMLEQGDKRNPLNALTVRQFANLTSSEAPAPDTPSEAPAPDTASEVPAPAAEHQA